MSCTEVANGITIETDTHSWLDISLVISSNGWRSW